MLKFSFRELVLLALVFAVSVCWAIDHRLMVERQWEIYHAAEMLENHIGGPIKGYMIPRPDDP